MVWWLHGPNPSGFNLHVAIKLEFRKLAILRSPRSRSIFGPSCFTFSSFVALYVSYHSHVMRDWFPTVSLQTSLPFKWAAKVDIICDGFHQNTSMITLRLWCSLWMYSSSKSSWLKGSRQLECLQAVHEVKAVVWLLLILLILKGSEAAPRTRLQVATGLLFLTNESFRYKFICRLREYGFHIRMPQTCRWFSCIMCTQMMVCLWWKCED